MLAFVASAYQRWDEFARPRIAADPVLNAPSQHVSRAGFRSTDPHEQEADYFASALLVPAKLFAFAASRVVDGLQP